MLTYYTYFKTSRLFVFAYLNCIADQDFGTGKYSQYIVDGRGSVVAGSMPNSMLLDSAEAEFWSKLKSAQNVSVTDLAAIQRITNITQAQADAYIKAGIARVAQIAQNYGCTPGAITKAATDQFDSDVNSKKDYYNTKIDATRAQKLIDHEVWKALQKVKGGGKGSNVGGGGSGNNDSELCYKDYCLYDQNAGAHYRFDHPFPQTRFGLVEDYHYYNLWYFRGIFTAAQPFIPDGATAALHYFDGSGTNFWVDYYKAYREDDNIKNAINTEVRTIATAALTLKNHTVNSRFNLYGKLVEVKAASTTNLQVALNNHYFYIETNVIFYNDYFSTTFDVKMKDIYNFNEGGNFHGIPNSLFGDLSTVGLAKEFGLFAKLSG